MWQTLSETKIAKVVLVSAEAALAVMGAAGLAATVFSLKDLHPGTVVRVIMTAGPKAHLCVWCDAASHPVAVIPRSALKDAAIGDDISYQAFGTFLCTSAVGPLETTIPNSRRDDHAGRAFAIPVVWIVALLGAYWILSDWQALPRLISSTLAAM